MTRPASYQQPKRCETCKHCIVEPFADRRLFCSFGYKDGAVVTVELLLDDGNVVDGRGVCAEWEARKA